MDLFDDIEFEREKQRLLKTYQCETLEEVVKKLKSLIQDYEQNKFKQ